MGVFSDWEEEYERDEGLKAEGRWLREVESGVRVYTGMNPPRVTLLLPGREPYIVWGRDQVQQLALDLSDALQVLSAIAAIRPAPKTNSSTMLGSGTF